METVSWKTRIACVFGILGVIMLGAPFIIDMYHLWNNPQVKSSVIEQVMSPITIGIGIGFTIGYLAVIGMLLRTALGYTNKDERSRNDDSKMRKFS